MSTHAAPIPMAQPKNGFGITALCLALVGLLFGLLPITGFIAAGLGALAFVFAVIGWTRARGGHATNVKMSVISLFLAAGAVALGIWGMTVTFQATDKFVNDMNEIGTQLENIPPPPPMPNLPAVPFN